MRNAAENLAGLADVDKPLLRHVVLGHRDHIGSAVYCEGHWLRIQHITVAGFHLDQLIAAVRKLIREHQRAVVRREEGGDGDRGRVIYGLGDQLAGGQVADLESHTGRRDDLPGFR